SHPATTAAIQVSTAPAGFGTANWRDAARVDPVQRDLWSCCRHLFNGRPTLGRAGQNRGRPVVFGADMLAEPVHLHVFERITGATGGSLRAGDWIAHADDDS